MGGVGRAWSESKVSGESRNRKATSDRAERERERETRIINQSDSDIEKS